MVEKERDRELGRCDVNLSSEEHRSELQPHPSRLFAEVVFWGRQAWVEKIFFLGGKEGKVGDWWLRCMCRRLVVAKFQSE